MSTYDITLTLTVKNLNSKADAEDWAASLSEHINDTFNDDNSISPLVGVRVKKTARGK